MDIDEERLRGIGLYSRRWGVSGCDLEGPLVAGVAKIHEGLSISVWFSLSLSLGGFDMTGYGEVTRLV